MSIDIDVVSCFIGFLMGWICKVASSTITFSFFGKEHDGDSTVSAVALHMKEVRKKIENELDDLTGYVTGFKNANNKNALTKEEVDELCT